MVWEKLCQKTMSSQFFSIEFEVTSVFGEMCNLYAARITFQSYRVWCNGSTFTQSTLLTVSAFYVSNWNLSSWRKNSRVGSCFSVNFGGQKPTFHMHSKPNKTKLLKEEVVSRSLDVLLKGMKVQVKLWKNYLVLFCWMFW